MLHSFSSRFTHSLRWLVLLLLASGPVMAQAPLATIAAPLARPAIAAVDTATALHRLFAARRQRRNLLALGAVGAAALGTGVSSGSSNGFFSTGDYAKLYGIGAVAFIALDFAFGDSYSRRNEARALADLQAHQLAPRLRRKLKPHYFGPQ